MMQSSFDRVGHDQPWLSRPAGGKDDRAPVSIQTKVAAALLVVLMTALTTTAVLTYCVYQRTLAALVTSRFEFIGTELKRKIEAGLDLGLPLGELEMNGILRQEILTDDALLSLTIVNAKGAVLFTTESSTPAEAVVPRWLEEMTLSASPYDDVAHGPAEIDIALVNSFGKLAGALVVRYSEKYYAEKRQETARSLGEVTLLVLLVCGLVGICGTAIMSRPLENMLVRLDMTLRTLLVRVGVCSAAATPDGDITAFERGVLDAVSCLERAEAGLLPSAVEQGPSG